MSHSIEQPKDMRIISIIDTVDEDDLVTPIKERLRVVAFVIVILNFEGYYIKGYDNIVNTLKYRGSYSYELKKFDLDLMNKVTLLAWPSIEEPPIVKLYTIPFYLDYVFLGSNNTL